MINYNDKLVAVISVMILGLYVSGCAASSKSVMKPEAPGKTAVERPAAVSEQKITTASLPPSMPPPVSKPEAVPEKMTYSQITNLIGEFLDIKPVETNSGQTRFVGVSENNLVTLEMIGDKEDVSVASVKVVYPQGIEPVNADLNNAMMLRFLKNIAPDAMDWSSSIKQMVTKFYAMQTGQTGEENLPLKDKAIKVKYNRDENSITVTARRQ